MPEEEEEDWFEAAFEDDEDEEDRAKAPDGVGTEADANVEPVDPDATVDADADAESPADEPKPESDTADSDTDDEPDTDDASDDEPDTDDASDDEPDTDDASDDAPDFGGDADAPADEAFDIDTSETEPGGFGDAPDPGDADDEDESDLFGGDFAADFNDAPGPAGGGGDAGGAAGGGGGGGDFGFDLGGGGGAGGAAAGGGGGGAGGGFGFDLDAGAGGAPDSEDFDDEEFESAIPRINLGIEGLDAMIQGGVPERSLIVAIGGAGTGKTTFGLQFLNQAIKNGERAVYITLEETDDRVIRSAEEKGWPFEEYVLNQQLAVIDIDPVEMANSLTSIRNELPRLIEDFGASRLVLDSVSLLEMMYDEQATRRTEIYDFTRSLKQAGVTTMLTSEASEDNPFSSRHGIIEYLTDAVFVLRYVRPEDFRETRLAIEIQKIRDANHSRETKPYEITGDGISVYRQANIF